MLTTSVVNFPGVLVSVYSNNCNILFILFVSGINEVYSFAAEWPS